MLENEIHVIYNRRRSQNQKTKRVQIYHDKEPTRLNRPSKRVKKIPEVCQKVLPNIPTIYKPRQSSTPKTTAKSALVLFFVK